MATKEGGKRKRGKAFYTSAKKRKTNRYGRLAELNSGMQGVLITTGDQEKLCVPEAYNLLNQYADKLYGPEFPSDECLSDDISSALARETDSLKEKKERRFTAVQSGAKHLVFIVCGPPVEPCVLVHSMLTEVATKGERVSRYCQRMSPVVSVCHADMSDIRKHALVVLEPHFHTSHDTIIKYAVSYKARNNTVMKREAVIKLIANLVTADGEFDHQVDLDHPQLTVIVEIVKNLCCLSVVKDFHKLCKYNIHTLTEPKQTAESTTLTASHKEPEAEHESTADTTSTTESPQEIEDDITRNSEK